MKALVAHRLVGIDALAAEDRPASAPGPNEIVIATKATSLNLADLAALAGERMPRPALPFVPGLEAAGIVSAIGSGVKAFAPGDRVAAFTHWGALAEQIVAPGDLCAKLADGVSFATAAGLPMAYAGALYALRDRASLRAGETLLVMGSGGAAGLAAVDIGKRLGARVIAVAGTEARGSEALTLGADTVIDAASGPLAKSVADATGGKGADVIFDPVGGDATEAALRAAAPGARVICAGFAGGRVASVNIAALFSRGISLIAANTAFAMQTNPAAAQAALTDVIAWTADGSLHPRIAARFALSDIRAAFDYVKARRGAGSVIVDIAG